MQSVPRWANIPTMMFALARDWDNRPLLRWSREGRWRRMSWFRFAVRVASLARALRAAGVQPGDRVLLVCENRPEFPIAEVALQSIRAVPVPSYTTNTVADYAHVLRDSGATVAIVSTAALAAKVAAAAAQAGGLDMLVCMEPCQLDGIDVREWKPMVSEDVDFADISDEAAEIPPGALAVIIYTSGTSGLPRGVMLSHRAIIANCRSAYELLRPLNPKREIYLSFLPLSHAYEHTVGQFFLPITGTEIVYARGVEHLAVDMVTVRPTIMTMVPRVLDLIRGRILAQIAREKPWRQKLFHAAIAIGRKRAEHIPLSLWERMIDPLLERVVRRKVRARFGGRLRAIMSGGARLEPEIGRFFQGLGIIMMQGYGQTEAGPVISAVSALSTRIDTVGAPLQGVECRIAEDGEILVRGDLLMDGYWGLPEDTARTLEGGWLHTGDIGELDIDGSLRITDRKKDIIVLSGGENVAPARIEGMLVAEPAIAQAVVAGEGKSGLSALLVAADGFNAMAVAASVTEVNMRLSVTERVRKHVLVQAFTVDNGLLTATHKVRRHAVIARFGGLLEG